MPFEVEAREIFAGHYNCAQSVFIPFVRETGMDERLAYKIATPFGGGMGQNGQVCGAVSGALLAIGLLRGIDEIDAEKKAACYALAKEFQDRFVELHGDLTCPGLLGLDISDPEQLEEVREEDLFHTLCPVFVADAARIAGEVLGFVADK
jgi:C_GCAxxG_C_C family probable redox protein